MTRAFVGIELTGRLLRTVGMRLFRLLAFTAFPFCGLAQQAGLPIAGQWTFVVDQQSEHVLTARGELTGSGRNVTGNVGIFVVHGTLDGKTVRLEWTKPDKSPAVILEGQYEGSNLAGTGKDPDGLEYTWKAERDPGRSSAPRTIEFTPKTFERYLSGATAPALRIRPGDTVRTTSVDAGGSDASGKRMSRGGNPLTGPFYVEGALPGDTLVVKLLHIRPNRDWAQSGKEIVSNAVSPEYSANLHRGNTVTGRWHLDLKNGTASVEGTSDALKNVRVPLQPMLGGIGVAPSRQEVVNTRASGSFGGNMDYNRLREGTTVYLPVYQPGALLLLGDAHAAQGDGELAGDALETSMEFEFTVDVIRNFVLGMPYAEDGESWMAIGIGGSLENALRNSTTAMATYLEKEHGLNSNEAAMLLGAAMRYDIADLVGEQVSVVARLPKSILAQLPPRKDQF